MIAGLLPLAGLGARRARAAIDLPRQRAVDAAVGRRGLPPPRRQDVRARKGSRSRADIFRAGLFSSDPQRPHQVDRVALARLELAPLAAAFQVSDRNALVGLPQRLALLRRLGEALAARPDLFGAAGRPGHLVDAVLASSPARTIAAPAILALVLDATSGIWPSGLVVDGVALGDAWRHPAIRTQDRSNGIVPFHNSRSGSPTR